MKESLQRKNCSVNVPYVDNGIARYIVLRSDVT